MWSYTRRCGKSTEERAYCERDTGVGRILWLCGVRTCGSGTERGGEEAEKVKSNRGTGEEKKNKNKSRRNLERRGRRGREETRRRDS